MFSPVTRYFKLIGHDTPVEVPDRREGTRLPDLFVFVSGLGREVRGVTRLPE